MRGSILLLCLVFMAALSLAAMTAMQSAWSAQAMSSALLSHHRAIIGIEHQLLQVEHAISAHWRQTSTLPDEQTLLVLSNDSASVVYEPGLPAGNAPEPGSCEPLFSLLMQSLPGQVAGQGRAAARVRWDICCDLDEGCSAPQDFRRVRYWSRQLWSEAVLPSTASGLVNN